MAETPMQGLADYLRGRAEFGPHGDEAEAKLRRWASEVEAARASLPEPSAETIAQWFDARPGLELHGPAIADQIRELAAVVKESLTPPAPLPDERETFEAALVSMMGGNPAWIERADEDAQGDRLSYCELWTRRMWLLWRKARAAPLAHLRARHGADNASLVSNEKESDTALLRQCLEALEIGRDAAYEAAQLFHQAMEGYRFDDHQRADEEVAQIDAAIDAARQALEKP